MSGNMNQQQQHNVSGGNLIPQAVNQIHPVSSQQEFDALLEQANFRIFNVHELQGRQHLAEALRQNVRRARQFVEARQLPLQQILEGLLFMEFHLLEGWNLHRLGFTVPLDSEEGYYDLFDDGETFPLRSAAIELGVRVPPRPWLQVRPDPHPPRMHQEIVNAFLAGHYNGSRLTTSQQHVLHGMGLLLQHDQQQQVPAAPAQQHAALPAQRRPVQHQSQGSRQGQGLPVSNTPAAMALSGGPIQPPMGMNARHLPMAPVNAPVPVDVIRQRISASSILPRLTRRANQQAAGSARPTAPAPPAPPAPQVPVQAQAQAPARQARVHVGLKDTPSPNVPFPANMNITLAEMMAFLPQWLRSVDVINRLYQNRRGDEAVQSALANMATAHRRYQVEANMLWYVIKAEKKDEDPTWAPKNHVRSHHHLRDNLDVHGFQTMAQHSGRRGRKPSYPAGAIPFSRLAENVKHLPTGPDALDLTRCVQEVLNNPVQTAGMRFPDDYATVLARVGGPAQVTAAHQDQAAFGRWGGAGTVGCNRAQGTDAQWNNECAQHIAAHWPPSVAAPGPGGNNVPPVVANNPPPVVNNVQPAVAHNALPGASNSMVAGVANNALSGVVPHAFSGAAPNGFPGAGANRFPGVAPPAPRAGSRKRSRRPDEDNGSDFDFDPSSSSKRQRLRQPAEGSRRQGRVEAEPQNGLHHGDAPANPARLAPASLLGKRVRPTEEDGFLEESHSRKRQRTPRNSPEPAVGNPQVAKGQPPSVRTEGRNEQDSPSNQTLAKALSAYLAGEGTQVAPEPFPMVPAQEPDHLASVFHGDLEDSLLNQPLSGGGFPVAQDPFHMAQAQEPDQMGSLFYEDAENAGDLFPDRNFYPSDEEGENYLDQERWWTGEL